MKGSEPATVAGERLIRSGPVASVALKFKVRHRVLREDKS